MTKKVSLLLILLFGILSIFVPPATEPAEAAIGIPLIEIECLDFWDKEENADIGDGKKCTDPITKTKNKLSDTKDAIVDNTIGAAFGHIKTEFASDAANLFKETMGWWVSSESLLAENVAVAGKINGYFGGITMVMALIGFGVAAIKTIVTGRGQPLGDALKALGIFAAISVMGLFFVEALTWFSDSLAAEIMGEEVKVTESSTKIEEALKAQGLLFLILMAPIMFIGSILQFCLMAMRDVSLVLMAGMIPVVAAGQFFKFSRPWLFRLFSAMFAVILYKPVAAIAYTIAFDLFLNASGLRAIVTAILMTVGASFTIKPLMALFQFTGVSLLDKSGVSMVGPAVRSGASLLKNYKAKKIHKSVKEQSQGIKKDIKNDSGNVTMTKQVPQNRPGSVNDAAKKELAKKVVTKAATKGAG